MSEPRSLPSRPDLRHLRDEAKRRRKAGEFPSLALAQLAIAREHGFRSWPRLKFHVEARHARRAAARRGADRLGHLVRPPARAGAARRRPDARAPRPGVRVRDGEADEVARRLAARPAAVSEPTGPYGWEPILYACFSRLLRGDARAGAGHPRGRAASCSPPAPIRTPRSSTTASGCRSRSTARPGSPATPS